MKVVWNKKRYKRWKKKQ